MPLVTSRRALLFGLGALLAAPMVVRATALMPINSLHLRKLKYIQTTGLHAGSIVELTEGVFHGYRFIPCDGTLIRGVAYPELFNAVRGRMPNEEDWLHIAFEDGHKPNPVTTVDYFHLVSNLEQ